MSSVRMPHGRLFQIRGPAAPKLLRSCCAYVAPHTCYQRKTEGIVGCLRRRDGHHQPGTWAFDRTKPGEVRAPLCPFCSRHPIQGPGLDPVGQRDKVKQVSSRMECKLNRWKFSLHMTFWRLEFWDTRKRLTVIELKTLPPYEFQVRGSATDVEPLWSIRQREYEADVFSEVPGVGTLPGCAWGRYPGRCASVSTPSRVRAWIL